MEEIRIGENIRRLEGVAHTKSVVVTYPSSVISSLPPGLVTAGSQRTPNMSMPCSECHGYCSRREAREIASGDGAVVG